MECYADVAEISVGAMENIVKVGDLVKGYVPNPYRPQVGIVIKTDPLWDGNEIEPAMIEVLWSTGAFEKISSDDISVVIES